MASSSLNTVTVDGVTYDYDQYRLNRTLKKLLILVTSARILS